MGNSKTYWDKTLNEFEENFCACDCVNDHEHDYENNNTKTQGEEIQNMKDLDNLFYDKRKDKNYKENYDLFEYNGILYIIFFLSIFLLKNKFD